jgi:hypothetical protein
MKKIFNAFCITLLTGASILPLACKKGLDYQNTNAISPDNVWKDPAMIGAFLNDIYAGLMPGWGFDGNSSDEGYNGVKTLGNYQRGIISVDATTSALNYGSIEKINFFLDNISQVGSTVLLDNVKTQYVGEAKFWRAWAYWNMVRNIGGVPLILKAQKETDSLFVPRNKTSECVAQIVKDLDEAIAALPGKYTAASDYGRITKTAAMAFKGQVLLWYASPLFNPTNQTARWQAAYDANKAAKEYAESQGFGLFANYRNIWYTERNKEVIMVRQYINPGSTNSMNLIRPIPLTKDNTNNNQPVFSLLMAYPKRDGSPMQFDKNLLANDAAYNEQFMTDFYTNRDDRFYATIFFGGTPYPTPDEVSPVYVKGNSFWDVWRYDGTKYVSAMANIHSGMTGGGQTGFWDRKGLDTTLVAALYAQGQTDWPVIRYAEVLMNFGEAANELGGHQAEALDVLKQIRQRAGIAAGGSGNYGITASTQVEFRDAYIKERQVEFAFENKRLPDLRRWKRYDILNTQMYKSSIYAVMKDAVTVLPSENILNAATRVKFKAVFIENLDNDASYKFNLDLNHWFYAIPPSQIAASKNKIMQNSEWGGTFDPLQ